MSFSAIRTIVVCISVLIMVYFVFKFSALPFFKPLNKHRWAVLLICLCMAVAVFLFAFVFSNAARVFFIYLFFYYLLADLINFITSKLFKKSRFTRLWNKLYFGGALILVLALATAFYAYWNAKHFSVKQYNITVSKPLAVPSSLKIMFVSDMHIGTAIKKPQLDKLLKFEEELKPDIVLLGGDIYDKTPKDDINYSLEIFSRFKAPYGVFFVTGNHEYGHNGPGHEIFALLEKAGVRVLNDEFVFIDNRFILAGRKDLRAGGRSSMQTLFKGINANYPVILMDHRPTDFKNAQAHKVDIQLSGHTHAGQVFPAGMFYKLQPTNEMFYGHKKFNGFNAIVTSGLGTWGFASRIGSSSEIVIVNVTFTK